MDVMSAEPSPSWQPLAERITRFEEAAMYLERSVEQLDGHVCHLQKCLDALEGRVQRLESFLERAADSAAE
jgi:prefoldin subunit 5